MIWLYFLWNYFYFFCWRKTFRTRFGILFQCSAQLRAWLGGRPRRWEGFSIRGLKRKWSSAFEIHNSSLMVFHFYELKIDNWIFLFTWSYGKNNRVLRMKVTILTWIEVYMALSWVDKNWTIKVDCKNSLSNEGTKYVTFFATIFCQLYLFLSRLLYCYIYLTLFMAFDPNLLYCLASQWC